MATNLVILQGRLTKDPNYEIKPSGTEKATFNLAVQQDYKNEHGQREADFIRIVGYGKLANNLVTYAKKGSQLNVVGRLSVRKYEQNGETKYMTEVKLDKFYLLDSIPNVSRPPQQATATPSATTENNHTKPPLSPDEMSLFAGQTTQVNPNMATAPAALDDGDPF
ncbi:single-stranded DNA-binding protein [Lactococcus lactis subsp. lactis]|uniref:single-stranded DNA-binding protein n=1 Tax=Lactococcus lactis TaxID=1358 RepID=UPI00223AD159|nr:single-stranded DNA-binding protein [Lactococcus lactis]MCT0017702.1 single-stranded DNA-binding protein [Lactococcus lactis subsp. lactis]